MRISVALSELSVYSRAATVCRWKRRPGEYQTFWYIRLVFVILLKQSVYKTLTMFVISVHPWQPREEPHHGSLECSKGNIEGTLLWLYLDADGYALQSRCNLTDAFSYQALWHPGLAGKPCLTRHVKTMFHRMIRLPDQQSALGWRLLAV